MDRNFYRNPQTDGVNRASGYGAALVYPPEEGNFANMPFGMAAEREGWITLLDYKGPGYSASVLGVTETKDNAGTMAFAAGGLVWTFAGAPIVSGDDLAINSVRAVTVVANRMWRAVIRLKQSSVANEGLRFGIVTSGGTEYFTAAPTDGIYFAKAANSAVLTLEVVENGNASVQTTNFAAALGSAPAALSLVDDTEIVIAFEVFLGTNPASGGTTRGRVIINGVETNLSSTVAAALYALLNTTPPTFAAHLGTRVNGTTARTMTIQHAWVGVMRY